MYITTYLSAPNIVNSCNEHVGRMYRLYPDISYPSFLKSQVLEALPGIIKEQAENIKHYLDGLLSVSGHALNPLVDCFNPETGKPKIAHKVGDWPHIKHAKGNTTSLVYITNLIIGKNTVGEVSDVLVSFFKGDTDVNQLFQIYKYLDTDTHKIGFKEKKELDIKDQCVLHFDAHYRVKENKPWKSVKKAAAIKSTNLWILKQINRVSPDTIKKSFEDKKLAERLLELKEKYDVRGNQLIIKEKYRNDTSIDDIVNKMQMLLELEEVRKFDWALNKGSVHIEKPTIKSTFFPKKKEDIQYQKREQLDDEIDDLLKDKPYLVISGPPGQGKSTFASYYIKSKSKNEGCLVRYISASSENDIIASFKQIAAGYEIKGIEDEYLTQIILAKLSDQGKYNNTDVILCLDNVESYDDISECLDNLDENVKAIITTRNPMIVVNKEYVFKLPPFNKKESLKYLKKNLPSKFRGVDQLEKLIAEVGDDDGNTTPYHMNKVVAWFKENRFEATIDGYIKDIRTYKEEGEEEPETKMLLDFLNQSENNVESWKLLQYVSYLDPDFIDAQILAKLLDLDGLGGLTNAVDPLLKLSLIDEVLADSGGGIAVHRLVQKTTSEYITKHKDNPKVPTLAHQEIQEKLIKTLNELMPMVGRPTKKWDEAAKSYKHVEKLLKEIDFQQFLHDNLPSEDKTVLKELSSLLTKAGYYNLYATSTYKQSLEHFKHALQLNEAIYGKNHSDVATSYNNVGITYGELGKHEQALEYKEKALQIRLQVLPENHLDVATSYNNVGCTYGQLGDQAKALKYKEKALDIRLEALGENHRNVATSYNNVGYTYGKRGDHVKALKYKKKALEIRLKVLPENHPDVAISYNNVGGTYGQMGKHAKALEYKEKALQIYLEALPENHPNVATFYNNMGITCGKLGDHGKALKYKEKALDIRLEALGEKHPSVATSYNNVGITCGKLGEYKKALDHLKKSLEIRLEALGEKHPSVATSYNNVGYTYGQLGDHAKALGYLEKGLQICEGRFGNSPNSLYAKTLKNIAFQHKSLSNNGEALKYYNQSYEMFNNLENKDAFAKDIQDIESEIANLEELALKTQDNENEDVSSVNSIIPNDDSSKDGSEVGILGEVAPE